MFSLGKELPWDQPSSGCAEYLCWKENKYTTSTPWCKLDTLTLSLLRKILVANPAQRLTLDKLQDHKWCQTQFHLQGMYGFSLPFPVIYKCFYSRHIEKVYEFCMFLIKTCVCLKSFLNTLLCS
uniref:Protein kinase domain-containing protein n=1 Tax=Anopheles maculatus TaxID=74869 RepID=A0A182SHY0_9DIPT